ncbi:MAG: hypothetical protein JNM68_17180 [Dinghuibacter sp.]|nr:hypothetical protein [Dinghuibacter sp.]
MKSKKQRTVWLNKRTVVVLNPAGNVLGGAPAAHPTIITTTIISSVRTGVAGV